MHMLRRSVTERVALSSSAHSPSSTLNPLPQAPRSQGFPLTMRSAVVTAMAILMAQSCSPSLAVIVSRLFHRVWVSNAVMMASDRIESVIPSRSQRFSNVRCSSVCMLAPWCQVWCRGSSSDECFLSNMIVMPAYVESNMADALACYTRRQRDLATYASIQGCPLMNDLKAASNLVDGIYDMKTLTTCHLMSYITNPWYLLDLGAARTFSLVRLYGMPAGKASGLLNVRDLEFRVSVSPAATLGDFSSFDLFGTFVGPATEFNQEIVLTVATPVTARYLSVQRSGTGIFFQTCHIEVH